MTVYEVPNIEHCDVTMVGTIAYRIFAHEGWYIHRRDLQSGFDEEGNPVDVKMYQAVVVLRSDYDFSNLEITAEEDLPGNAMINDADTNNPEVM